ncbi:MAG: hypothetical protein QOI29_2069 [Mycobacterium sp.]|jgi:hypothetical protein|nr:hypothetical protein [Mycobacterium sp.]
MRAAGLDPLVPYPGAEDHGKVFALSAATIARLPSITSNVVAAAQPTLFRGGKIFTIQPFSRKCPIGHPEDTPLEIWTSSLRIYTKAVASLIACHIAAA